MYETVQRHNKNREGVATSHMDKMLEIVCTQLELLVSLQQEQAVLQKKFLQMNEDDTKCKNNLENLANQLQQCNDNFEKCKTSWFYWW